VSTAATTGPKRWINNKKDGYEIRNRLFWEALVSVYANLLLILGLLLELYLTVDQREQSVILTDSNVVTGMNGSSSLSYDDIAGKNSLSVCLLYAKALRLTVTSVLGRTDTLFMSKEL